ncbi:ribosome production factor [Raphidocelis subcapitata]|uniref:Ribosome production factor 2 homolog n=1 Tax=Raphidocelis subcapitata TaxID=307507 RepID=A0A2V0PL44_9CHLO|nr:ribosome production factor [Raphidocelis subcapitata]|eukprot:GBG00525.1 ribosome production factor [Raphidocelis subcapitata]
MAPPPAAGAAAAAAAALGGEPQATTLVKPLTRRGKRALEKRAPKLVEDAKRGLFLFGGATSAVIKDVLTDLHKLKGSEAVKFTRKNDGVKPFEPGGESALEFFSRKSNCSLFALGSHTKKRPHNLTLGRLFDFRLYDAIELGVERHRAIKEFGGAASAQAGNKPAMLFVGERFEGVPEFKLAKSLLLDFFRGLEVRGAPL